MPAGDSPPALVARVVPDVTGLDKHFDYVVPAAWHDVVRIGSLVRVPLHGRRVGGWVVALGAPDPTVPVERLLPLAKVSSIGPPADLLELASWAMVRWGAARVRPFLVVADPPTMVQRLPPRRRTVTVDSAGSVSSGVRCITPLTDPLPLVERIARGGPAIVVHPAPAAARAVANRLRRTGLSVALLPDDWAQAAAGVDVVVGSRGAVWAPCPDLRAIVVLDEHDESLQDERSPTWHARDVAIERAARSGAACVLVSPCPSAAALHWAGDRVERPDHATVTDDAAGWPRIDIVDRSDEEPWKRSLVSSDLIQSLRDPSLRVACVLNTTGRARLLACRSCRSIQRCTECDAAVAQTDDQQLVCRRCQHSRPTVCQRCGSSAMALVKPGVTRLREELEAAANRTVVAVTGDSDELAAADVYIGTEAVLHRVRNIDVVVFLDIDAELLAPRYRAAEQAMALVVRAARLVGPRRGPGRVILQTFVPDHPVLRAAASGDPTIVSDGELARRRLLGLPPFRALALVEGDGAAEFAAACGLEHAPHGAPGRGALVRADTWEQLGRALGATPRPKGSRLRVEVDPPRA